jgi:hypothetical protein
LTGHFDRTSTTAVLKALISDDYSKKDVNAISFARLRRMDKATSEKHKDEMTIIGKISSSDGSG